MLKYIDNRNRLLWLDLSKKYQISIQETARDHFACYSSNEQVIIFVCESDNPVEDFTHELLHVFINSLGVNINSRIKKEFDHEIWLKDILDHGLIDHIGNCLNHQKMLPIFLKMGFEREKFLSDFFIPKCTHEQINSSINLMKLGGSAWKVGAHLSIASFFSIKGCPNNSFNYSDCLSELENAESSLYNILNSFWTDWEQFDVKKFEPIINDYYRFTCDFIENLGEWARIHCD